MTEKPDGNGAREALIKIMDDMGQFSENTTESIEIIADGILMELAEAGYVIKPIVEH